MEMPSIIKEAPPKEALFIIEEEGFIPPPIKEVSPQKRIAGSECFTAVFSAKTSIRINAKDLTHANELAKELADNFQEYILKKMFNFNNHFKVTPEIVGVIPDVMKKTIGQQFKAKPFTATFSAEPVEVCIYAYDLEDAKNLAQELAQYSGAFIFDQAESEVIDVCPHKRGHSGYTLNDPSAPCDSDLMIAMRKAGSLSPKEITDRNETSLLD